MTPGRYRRRAGATAHGVDEGPFVSFTDLFIGILFLFLILVAALMLMHQEAVQRERVEAELMSQRIRELQAKLDAAPKKDDRPVFRLGLAFNIYQRQGRETEWTFSRTVRVFRSPQGLCINTVWLRSNLSTAWRPPVSDEDIPTTDQRGALGKIETCGLTRDGDRWDSATETGRMTRISRDLYEGYAILHKKEGDARVEIQYRILGVYDDYFR